MTHCIISCDKIKKDNCKEVKTERKDSDKKSVKSKKISDSWKKPDAVSGFICQLINAHKFSLTVWSCHL